jgi:hypothetical protein
MFKLEALQADRGDSLLLRYGSDADPRLIVIDGGVPGVYQKSLRPRLEQLRTAAGVDQLVLQMVMVSHIDGDHIAGVIALTNEMIKAFENGDEAPYKILKLWHNSFDDFIKTDDVDALGAAMDSAIQTADAGTDPFGLLGTSMEAGAIAADVRQGRTLRDGAKRLALAVNTPFEKIVFAPAAGKETIDLGSGLKFVVIGPNKERLEGLQTKWNEKLIQFKLAKDAETAEAIAADFLDKSPENLSSIVVLAECEGKTMLLTGDARGDDIVGGLRSAGLLKNGKLHVDLLKLPHHGSDRNVSTRFFEAITADHYVISANGENSNPDIATLVMLSEARGQDKFTIHLTNEENRLVNFFAQEKAKGKNYDVLFRRPNDLSIEIVP